MLGALVTVALATASLVVGGTGAVSAAPDSRLTRFPYLTNLVGTSVTVNWATLRTAGTTSVGSVRLGTPGPGGACTLNPNGVAASRTNLAIGPTATQVLEYQWSATVTLPAGTSCYSVFLQSNSVPSTDLLAGGPYPTVKPQIPAGSNTPYTFAVLGDWGEVDQNGQNPDLANVMSQIASSGAQFAVTTGDNAYNSGTQEDYGDLQQTSYTNPGNPSAVPPVPPFQVGMSAVFGPSFWTVPGRSIPMFATPGNHGLVSNDANGHPQYVNWPEPTAVSTSGGSYATHTYDNTGTYGAGATATIGDAWYAFDAGNARFYVLTTAWPDSAWGANAPANTGGYANDYLAHWTQNAAEYKWLAADLAAHPGGVKFAFFHKPLTSDTSSKNEASDMYLRSDGPAGNQSLEALLADNNVAIAFSGHAHIYERNGPHGGGASLINYVTGGGGAAPESLGSLGNCDTNDLYAIAWSPSSSTGSHCGQNAPDPTDATHFFHFLKVTVNGTHVTVTPTDEMGRTFDVQSYDFGPQYTQLVGGAATTPEGNSGTHVVNVPVSLTKANPSDTVTVQYATTSAGSAKPGVDFVATSGTLSFPPGQITETIPVSVIGNTVAQANRVIAVQLSNATHAGIAGFGLAAATIVDDDGGVTSASASSGGYVVDGFGTLHTVTTGTAHALGGVRGDPHWSFDIARGVALLPNHTGGYVLDGFGGLHPFAVGNNAIPAATRGGPYWNGWDIAKGVAINPDGKGGYVVDAWGGLHPFAIGNNPIPAKPTGASYWTGWNIVRGVTVLANGGGYTVDGWGGLHPFTVNGHTAPQATGGPYWSGWDIVRGVTTTPDGSAGFVLDGFGGAHSFRVTASAPAVHITAFWNGTDIARGIAL
jgi:hypothetical protein